MKLLKNYYFILFAAFPVLQFYNANRSELNFDALPYPLVFLVLASCILYAVLRAFRVSPEKRALITTLLFLYIFSYQHIANLTGLQYLDQVPGWIRDTILVLLYSAIFFVLFRKLLHSPRLSIAGFFAILGLYLVIVPLLTILPQQVERAGKQVQTGENTIEVDRAKVTTMPDIYYIILDRYANGQILKENYKFDNNDFLSFLENQGFYVAQKSFTNYPKTHLSLASTLNIDYLDELVKRVGENNGDYSYAYNMVQDNKVARTLKNLGYRYIYFGDWWEPTRVSPYADKNINLYATTNEFSRKLFTTTVLYPVTKEFLKSKGLVGFSESRVYENTLYKFAELKKISAEPSPKFVFAHMLLPHYPYIFDKNCNKVEDVEDSKYRQRYVEQLQCTNKHSKEFVIATLQNSKTPPIIIIQSDEGPFEEKEMNRSGEGVDWNTVSDTALRIHMKILNAYLLPGFDYTRLYSSISPVNTYRLIFDHYFGTQLNLLPDRSYKIPHLNYPYRYTEITDIVAD